MLIINRTDPPGINIDINLPMIQGELGSGCVKASIYCSVAEPEPPGAATFRAAPEPIFFLVGAGSRSRLF